MKRFWIFALMIGYLLGLFALGSPAGATEKNFQKFVLTNEGSGFISKLVVAGYGTYALYDAVVAMQQLSDLYIAGVLTDPFLETLAHCPAGSEIFTHQLNKFNLTQFPRSERGQHNRETVNVYGSFYVTQPGTSTMVSNISGVGLIEANLLQPRAGPSPPGPTLSHPTPSTTMPRLAWAGYRLEPGDYFQSRRGYGFTSGGGLYRSW